MEGDLAQIQMEIPNILDSGIDLGDKVCIVAPGPNGLAHYTDIPNDYTIVVVNKAVLIDAVKPDLWVIAHTDNSWFDTADQIYSGIRAYREVIIPSISQRTMKSYREKVYFFKLEEEQLPKKGFLPLEGYIRYGGTVSGIAIQLAYNMGVREILLCGLDMSGNAYWDKSENEDENVHHMHGAIWDGVARLNPLLNHLRNDKGVHISTLSKTTLDVPYFKPKKV